MMGNSWALLGIHAHHDVATSNRYTLQGMISLECTDSVLPQTTFIYALTAHMQHIHTHEAYT